MLFKYRLSLFFLSKIEFQFLICPVGNCVIPGENEKEIFFSKKLVFFAQEFPFYVWLLVFPKKIIDTKKEKIKIDE